MSVEFEKAWSDIYWIFAEEDMVFDSYHHGLWLAGGTEVIHNGQRFAEVPF